MNKKHLNIIASGALITLIGILISKLFSYSYRLIVSRLGSESYGLISLAFAVVGILSIFTSIGLDFGITRYISYYKSKNDLPRLKGTFFSAFKISFVLSIIFSIILFFSSNFISNNLFHNQNLSIILKIFSLVLIFQSVRKIITETLRAFKKINYYVISLNIIEPVINLILTLIFIYLGYHLIGISIAYVSAVFISLAISIYFLEKKVFPVFTSKIASIYENKELISYSWPLMFSTALARFIVWTDILFLGFYKTVSDVGIYNTAIPTAQLLLIAPTAILNLFVPIITELIAKNNPDEIKTVYQTTTKWIFFINLPITLFFIINSTSLLRILFGAEYSIGFISLIILSIGYFINSILFASRYMLDSLKKTKFILLNTIIVTIINIILNLILIPKYGILGAAIATALTTSLFGIINWIKVYSINKINIFRLNYFKSVIASLIAIFPISFLLKITGIKTLLLSFILSGIIYLVLMLITKALSKDDLEVINTLLKLKKVKNLES